MAPACPTGQVAVHPAGGRGLTDRSARACHHGRMPQSTPYRSLSYWLDSVPGDLVPADPLPGDLDVDVAIAGAGFTGLWTAYYLAKASPGLRIAVLEREIAGFGASGRNGGWCSALFPASLAKLERMAGRDAAAAMYRAMQDSGDKGGRVAAAAGSDCHRPSWNAPVRRWPRPGRSVSARPTCGCSTGPRPPNWRRRPGCWARPTPR